MFIRCDAHCTVLTLMSRKLSSAFDPAAGKYDLDASAKILENFVAEVKVPCE